MKGLSTKQQGILKFMRDFIASHYSERITEALATAGGRRVSVMFEVEPDLFAEVRREEHRIFDAAPPPPPPRPRRRHGTASTLESFVVGVCNRLGFNAALQVLECPGRHYNPLFIHGPTGVGKSHLLQGLATAFRTGGGDAVKRFGERIRELSQEVADWRATVVDQTDPSDNPTHAQAVARAIERDMEATALATDVTDLTATIGVICDTIEEWGERSPEREALADELTQLIERKIIAHKNAALAGE